MALKLGISISEEFVLSVWRKVKHDRRGHVGQGSGSTPKEDSFFLLESQKSWDFGAGRTELQNGDSELWGCGFRSGRTVPH